MQKKKQKKIFKLQKYICKKKAQNNISKKHAQKKAEMQKKAAKKAGGVYIIFFNIKVETSFKEAVENLLELHYNADSTSNVNTYQNISKYIGIYKHKIYGAKT